MVEQAAGKAPWIECRGTTQNRSVRGKRLVVFTFMVFFWVTPAQNEVPLTWLENAVSPAKYKVAVLQLE